jgi:ABC-type uncharacterized transport system ATPase subunit
MYTILGKTPCNHHLSLLEPTTLYYSRPLRTRPVDRRRTGTRKEVSAVNNSNIRYRSRERPRHGDASYSQQRQPHLQHLRCCLPCHHLSSFVIDLRPSRSTFRIWVTATSKAAASSGSLSRNTDVGEGGSSLSGGQRARVSLARALYSGEDTNVFLLDDCIAALDASVGSLVFERVTKRLRRSNAAAVFVTNDPSLPRRCDRVVLMGPTDGSKKSSFSYHRVACWQPHLE